MPDENFGKPLRPFPESWGSPPAWKSMDKVQYPGYYGEGPSNWASWIQKNIKKEYLSGKQEDENA